MTLARFDARTMGIHSRLTDHSTAMQKANGETTALSFPRKTIMANQPTRMAPSSRHPFNGTGVLRISGEPIRLGTWNVRTLYEAGKLRNVIEEMKRLNVHIMGLSKIRWPGSGELQINDMTFYYSGTANNAHRHGVGILVNSSTAKVFSILFLTQKD